MKIEMGNIPDECHDSASASMLAMKRLQCWVFVRFGKKKGHSAFKFDLRPGREAEQTDESIFDEFGGDNFRGVA